MALTPADIESRICWEQDGLLVFDKPHDIPSTGRQLDDSDCVQWHLIQRHGGMVWAVHQLDADTSGLNLFVTRRELVAVHHERLRSPNSAKTYLAIVHGAPDWTHQDVDQSIGHVDARSLGVTPVGKAARSRFQVRARSRDHALVEGRLLTGRTHQLRIHLTWLGHPLVGEEWYRERPCLEHPRQALHAWRLGFADGHPPDALEAPLAPDLVALADRLGLEVPVLPSSWR